MTTELTTITEHPSFMCHGQFPREITVGSFHGGAKLTDVYTEKSARCIQLITRSGDHGIPSNVTRLTESQAMEMCRAIIDAYRPNLLEKLEKELDKPA